MTGSAGARAVTVVIADDDPGVRAALADLIDEHPRMHVIGRAPDGRQAASLCVELGADLAVVDVRMPHGGVEAVDAIRTANPSTIVVVYPAVVDRRTRQSLLDAGAASVFLKGGRCGLGDELIALLAR